MPGVRRALVLLPVLPLVLTACAPRRAGEWPAKEVPAAYSASFSLTLTDGGGRSLAASGGCAVDPRRGARLEARDPMGGTRLLLLVRPSLATLFVPASGHYHAWMEASAALPFSSRDLWAVLTGSLPARAYPGPAVPGAEGVSATWHNAMGGVRGRFYPGGEDVPLYDRVVLSGPRQTSLDVSLSAVEKRTFAGEAFSLPETGAAPVSARAILAEVFP